ncbi:MAG: carbon-nitrogen hydrolase family protein [Anaerolineae bacterium]|nr:carbon-nitrogen hydrolase family protein [Anaerolineae bacterium]
MPELRVAAVQMDAPVGQVEANLARAEVLVERAAAQGAQLVVLPELFNTGYEYTDQNFHLAEPLDGRTGTWIKETARRLGVHLVGTFPALANGDAFITAMLAAPDGRQWLYQKMHVAIWENFYFARGTQPLVAHTDLGRIGLLICWDEIFADLARAYRGNVDLLCIPSSPPSFIGQLEDHAGRVAARCEPSFAGRRIQAARWFGEAQRRHALNAGAPVVYAARCGEFLSPIPYNSFFLMTVGARNALRTFLTAGRGFRLRSVLMGCSCIYDARGEPLAAAGQDEEAVLVADVQAGMPSPGSLPPAPRGRTLVPDVSWTQLVHDDVMICLGARYRRKRLPGWKVGQPSNLPIC